MTSSNLPGMGQRYDRCQRCKRFYELEAVGFTTSAYPVCVGCMTSAEIVAVASDNPPDFDETPTTSDKGSVT